MSLEGIALATDFVLLIVAATILCYVARLTKQPTIVTYVLTGVVVGPIGFGIVAEDRLIEIIAELGLGFLLFLLGIEMRFDDQGDRTARRRDRARTGDCIDGSRTPPCKGRDHVYTVHCGSATRWSCGAVTEPQLE